MGIEKLENKLLKKISKFLILKHIKE